IQTTLEKGVISILNRLSTQTVNWILVIGIILFTIEIIFFRGGLIVTAVLLGAAVYIGWKHQRDTWGKVVFWIGLIGLLITFLNMLAVRFIVIIFIILYLIDYSKTKHKRYLQPEQSIDPVIVQDEPIVKMHPLFTQMLYGDQKAESNAFEWRDINIHGGIGDRVIDLSNAVTLDDTAIISIRHGIGNITIYIPYDTDFMIHHSAVFGRAYILNKQHEQLLNQQLSYQTEYYPNAMTRVKIVTTLISGNIEVKRI